MVTSVTPNRYSDETEVEWLRRLYIEDLEKEIMYDGRTRRPRVRKTQPFKNIPLTEGVEIDQSKTWVWSDLHFGHKNIIEYCDRPFMWVQQMDEYLMANWNEYIQPEDTCIFVGDFSFHNETKTHEIMESLNGYKILVVGNHDIRKGKVRDMGFDETHLLYFLDIPGTPCVPLVFTHYPMDNLLEPWINVHGHTHNGPFKGTAQHINVCCEMIGYRPLELSTIIQQAKSRIASFDL